MPALAVTILIAACALAAQAACAQTYRFKLLARPYTSIGAVNDSGDVLINAGDASSFFKTKCFLVQGATRTRIADPNQVKTTNCTGLSERDTVVGYTRDSKTLADTGFTYSNGVYTETQLPVNGAEPLAISGDGRNVAGTFYPDSPIGYVLIGRRSDIFQVRDSFLTYATSINDAGETTVYSLDKDYQTHSYLRMNHKLTEYKIPGAEYTVMAGINDAGVVAGYYGNPDATIHGFVYDTVSGIATTVDVPNTTGTRWYGINNNGMLVGECIPASDNGVFIPFGVYATAG